MAKTPELNANIDYNKNYIINGSMRIAQRATSFVSPADGTYTLDRWRYGKAVSTATHTVTQDTDVPTLSQSGYVYQNSLRMNLTAADTSVGTTDILVISQRIEGYNWTPLAQKAFTLSFWVKATLPGTYCVGFRNSGQDRSYVAEYTINTTATWEYKTITVSAAPSAGTWNYSNGMGLEVNWAIAVGATYQTTANAWQSGNFLATANQVNGANTGATDFRLTGVQINSGSGAPLFKLFGRDIEGEIRACQRYYEKSYQLTVNPATVTAEGSYNYTSPASGAVRRVSDPFKTRKRANPAVNVYSPGTGALNNVQKDVTGDQAISFSTSNETRWGYEIAVSGAELRTYAHFTADAEL